MTSVEALEINFWRDPIQITLWGTPPSSWDPMGPPALKALVTSFDMRDPFIEGQSGGERHYASPSIFWSMAAPLATSVPGLRTLSLTHFDPMIVNDSIFPYDRGNNRAHPFTLYSHIFNRLLHLDLRLSALERLGTEDAVADATVRILRRAPRLPSLKLRIQDAIWCKPGVSDYWNGKIQSPLHDGIPVIEYFLRQRGPSAGFPHLKSLELQSAFCDGRALGLFLVQEVPKLQSLALKNIVLCKRGADATTDQRQCWLDILKTLRRRLYLTTVDFGGFLSNMGRQHWHIADDASHVKPNSVKARMINWFLDKSIVDNACPLNIFELSKDELDVTKDDDALRAATDESWTMKCPYDGEEWKLL